MAEYLGPVAELPGLESKFLLLVSCVNMGKLFKVLFSQFPFLFLFFGKTIVIIVPITIHRDTSCTIHRTTPTLCRHHLYQL